MPLLFGLSILVQILLVIHILKTGRNNYWIYLVIFAPLIGSVAYLIVELLPEFFGTRTGRRLSKNLDTAINPHRKLKKAARNLEIADTVENARRLAQECLDSGRFDDARDLFRKGMSGLYRDDPNLMLGLAQSLFGLQDYVQVKQTLDELKEKNPDYRNADAHLLYARALEQLGDIAGAQHEYEVLADYYPGPEPAVRLGLLLQKRGQESAARERFARVLTLAENSGRNYRDFHKEWISIAKREMQ
ncbi:MAG TPA: tetratricopeptide repeat protein [Dongiaceae bacterium]|nr:tetratricopeptide repeat protein [Dongiaceae bacterium]